MISFDHKHFHSSFIYFYIQYTLTFVPVVQGFLCRMEIWSWSGNWLTSPRRHVTPPPPHLLFFKNSACIFGPCLSIFFSVRKNTWWSWIFPAFPSEFWYWQFKCYEWKIDILPVQMTRHITSTSRIHVFSPGSSKSLRLLNNPKFDPHFL